MRMAIRNPQGFPHRSSPSKWFGEAILGKRIERAEARVRRSRRGVRMPMPREIIDDFSRQPLVFFARERLVRSFQLQSLRGNADAARA